MECEKVRDRFSSLLENELNPLEEKIVREHLTSCTECQKVLQQFGNTIRWLHSIQEVEVPDRFLSEIYKKMEGRERRVPLTGETRWQWFRHPFPLKLPVQAVAMVAVVFLVLYLTKMVPVETSRLKDAEYKKAPVTTLLPAEKQVGQVVAKKEVEKERIAVPPPLKEIEKTQTPVSGTLSVPAGKQQMEGALAEGAKGEQASFAVKPPQEIVLQSSDWEKTLNQLHELLQRFGGKIVTTEGNIFLASLPAVTLQEFEKELLGLGSPEKADKKMIGKEGVKGLDVPGAAKQRALEMKGKASAAPETEKQGYLLVRIIFLQE